MRLQARFVGTCKSRTSPVGLLKAINKLLELGSGVFVWEGKEVNGEENPDFLVGVLDRRLPSPRPSLLSGVR
jgi:hypothetical protein